VVQQKDGSRRCSEQERTQNNGRYDRLVNRPPKNDPPAKKHEASGWVPEKRSRRLEEQRLVWERSQTPSAASRTEDENGVFAKQKINMGPGATAKRQKLCAGGKNAVQKGKRVTRRPRREGPGRSSGKMGKKNQTYEKETNLVPMGAASGR